MPSRPVLGLAALVLCAACRSPGSSDSGRSDAQDRDTTWKVVAGPLPAPAQPPHPPASGFRHTFAPARPNDIVTGADGTTYIAGELTETVDFGGGAVGASREGIGVFVAAFDAQGRHLWSRGFGGSRDVVAEHLAADDRGNVVVAGQLTGAIDFGQGQLRSQGGEDIFVLALGPAGKVRWSRGFGAAGEDLAASVALDAQGNVVLTGTFTHSVDVGGGALPNRSALPSTDGDAFVAKLDSQGQHLWSVGLGGPEADSARAVAVTDKGIWAAGTWGGNLELAGVRMGEPDQSTAALVHLDATGKPLWTRSLGAVHPQRIAVDGRGEVFVAGEYQGQPVLAGRALPPSGTQVRQFITKLDSRGAAVWNQSFAGARYHATQGLGLLGSGDVLLVSNLSGPVTFGDEALAAGDTTESRLVAALLTSDGQVRWGCSVAGVQATGGTTGSNGAAYATGTLVSQQRAWLGELGPGCE